MQPAILSETGRRSQDGVHVTRLLWRLLEIQLQTRDLMFVQSQSLTFLSSPGLYMITRLSKASFDWLTVAKLKM